MFVATTENRSPTMKPTATLPVIGMNIAKNVFQLHVVDAETGEACGTS